MKSTVEKLSPTRVKLSIDVEFSELKPHIEGAYKTLSEKNDEELSVIPLGIPIAFGTGLFTTIIIFKHQAQTALDLFSISMAFCLNALVFYIILKSHIERCGFFSFWDILLCKKKLVSFTKDIQQ